MARTQLADIDSDCGSSHGFDQFAWVAKVVWQGKRWAKRAKLRVYQKARTARHRTEALRRRAAAHNERRLRESFAAMLSLSKRQYGFFPRYTRALAAGEVALAVHSPHPFH